MDSISDFNKKTKTLSLDKVKQKIFEIYGNSLTLIEDTYINARTKATFIHDMHGEWLIAPTLLINRKYKNPKTAAPYNKLSAQDIKNRLKEIHGNEIILDESTYIDTHTKSRFIDKNHGEFWASAKAVTLNGVKHPKKSLIQRKETMKERYGAENPQQVHSIALRTAKSSNNSHVKYHWKTNEELICKGSYEAKVVDYLNKCKINFLWQPQVFVMPNGKTYLPDLYLINENKWIEIKGYMRKDAQEKWDWFLTQFPTAELWNKETLAKRNIYVK